MVNLYVVSKSGSLEREVVLIFPCTSFYSFIRFCDISSIVFSEILHDDINLETEKSDKSWFYKKFFHVLKLSNMVKNGSKIEVPWVKSKLCYHFLLEDKMNDLSILFSYTKPGKILLHKIQSEIRLSDTLWILWSLVSLEGKHQHCWFCAWN